MEKKDSVAIVASKAAGEEAPVPIQAPVEASVAAAVPVQAPVPVRVPVPAWNPYEEPPEYVPPENPFDPNIVDNEPEVTRVWSPSSYPIRIVFC
jgi:hypothetical protein